MVRSVGTEMLNLGQRIFHVRSFWTVVGFGTRSMGRRGSYPTARLKRCRDGYLYDASLPMLIRQLTPRPRDRARHTHLLGGHGLRFTLCGRRTQDKGIVLAMREGLHTCLACDRILWNRLSKDFMSGPVGGDKQLAIFDRVCRLGPPRSKV